MGSDQTLIDRMVAAGGDATFAQLATEIVTSKQFRHRLRQEEVPTTSRVAAHSLRKSFHHGVSK